MSTTEKKPTLAKKLLAGFAIIALILACYLGVKTLLASDNCCKVIPQNASAVVKLDPTRLLSQSDIDIEKLLDEFDIDMKDIEKFGIDFKHPGYLFVYSADKNDNKPVIGVSVAMASTRKFEAWLKKEFDGYTAKNEGKYKQIVIDDFVISYDKKKMLLLSNENVDMLKKQSAKLMKQSKGESFMTSKLYEEMNNGNEAIVSIADYGKLLVDTPDEENALFKELLQKYQGANSILKDLHVRCSIKTEKNKIVLYAETLPQTAEAKKQLEDGHKVMPNIRGTFLGSDNDNILWASTNLKGKEYLEFFKKYADDNTKELVSKVEKEYHINLTEIISAIDGDISLCWGGYVNDKTSNLGVYAHINDVEILHKLDSTIQSLAAAQNKGYYLEYNDSTGESKRIPYEPEEPIVSLKEVKTNQYEFTKHQKWGEYERLFFGIKNNIFYLSNANARIPGTNPTGFLKDYSSDIKNSRIYFVVDLKPFIAFLKQTPKAYRQVKRYIKHPDLLDKFVIRGDEKVGCEMYISIDKGYKLKNLFFEN